MGEEKGGRVVVGVGFFRWSYGRDLFGGRDCGMGMKTGCDFVLFVERAEISWDLKRKGGMEGWMDGGVIYVCIVKHHLFV